jgi:hypothetical protein
VTISIDEAIEILTEVKQLRIPTGKLDELRACNLGIEALKRHKERTRILWSDMMQPLPGETEK